MSLIGDFWKSLYREELPEGHLLCPDCNTAIPSDYFVQHRERIHPPSPRTITVPGTASNERFGYQED